MQTLSYGFLLPETGDKGPTLWEALSTNIQKLNDHTHDGMDSPLLAASAITSTRQNISALNWADYGGPQGHYRQLVSMPPGYDFDKKNIAFRTLAGEYVYPTVVKVDQTSYYIYSTSNSLELIALYGG